MIATGGIQVSRPRRVHVPVLVHEVVQAILGERDPAAVVGWAFDGTLGAGGHARVLLETFPNLSIFAIDQDPEMLAIARAELEEFGERAVLARGRISQLEELAAQQGIERAQVVFYDLGANSLHFDKAERGFSFEGDGPLDMRMDPDRERTAADIVNHWDEEDLADLFYHEGGEHGSRRIARALVEARRRVPFQRTAALAEVIAAAAGGRGGRIHPATRCFQALRRAVNEEGAELQRGLEVAERLLDDGGRLAVLSFHSGEDGVIKRFLQERARGGLWQLVNKKPLGPGATERRDNPRARSARLRAAVRLRSDEEGRP